jgi:tRNA A37 N6-isopentenylltransferase MiaA
MTTKAEITKEEFLQRMERSVQYAERQPDWMKGRPENRRETRDKDLQCQAEVASASTASKV